MTCAADRSMTVEILLRCVVHRLDNEEFEDDPLQYEVRFPEDDAEVRAQSDEAVQASDDGGEQEQMVETAPKADNALPPIELKDHVAQLRVPCLVVVYKSKRTEKQRLQSVERRIKSLKINTENSDEQTNNDTAKHSSASHERGDVPPSTHALPRLAVRVVVSPMALVYTGAKGQYPLSYLLLLKSGSRVVDVIQLLLRMTCKDPASFDNWVLRGTDVSVSENLHNRFVFVPSHRCQFFLHSQLTRNCFYRGAFWMHECSLGKIIDTNASVHEVALWKTVVLFPADLYNYPYVCVRSSSSHSSSGLHGSGTQAMKYLFTEQTASMYVEYCVVKVNRHGTRQERTLGIDREQIYNLMPRLNIDGDPTSALSEMDDAHPGSDDEISPTKSGSVESVTHSTGGGSLQSSGKFFSFSNSTKGGTGTSTKKRSRHIKQISKCEVDHKNPIAAHIVYKDGSAYLFEFRTSQECAEAVSRINYLTTL